MEKKKQEVSVWSFEEENKRIDNLEKVVQDLRKRTNKAQVELAGAQLEATLKRRQIINQLCKTREEITVSYQRGDQDYDNLNIITGFIDDESESDNNSFVLKLKDENSVELDFDQLVKIESS